MKPQRGVSHACTTHQRRQQRRGRRLSRWLLQDAARCPEFTTALPRGPLRVRLMQTCCAPDAVGAAHAEATAPPPSAPLLPPPPGGAGGLGAAAGLEQGTVWQQHMTLGTPQCWYHTAPPGKRPLHNGTIRAGCCAVPGSYVSHACVAQAAAARWKLGTQSHKAILCSRPKLM